MILLVYFFLNDTREALRLLFRRGSLVFGADCDKLLGRLVFDLVLVGDCAEDDDAVDALDAVRVGILE